MDIVKAQIEKSCFVLEVFTQIGKGTEIKIKLPKHIL